MANGLLARFKNLKDDGLSTRVQSKKFPLVRIHWIDSRQPASVSRWLSDLEVAGPVKCQSVGWLVSDRHECKVLAQNLGDAKNGDDMQISRTIEIPTACVTKITLLC